MTTGLRKYILKTTSMFLKVQPELLKRSSDKVWKILVQHKPNLKALKYKVLSAKKDQKGCDFA